MKSMLRVIVVVAISALVSCSIFGCSGTTSNEDIINELEATLAANNLDDPEAVSMLSNDDLSVVRVVGFNTDQKQFDPFTIEITKDSDGYHGEYLGRVPEEQDGSLSENTELESLAGYTSIRDYNKEYAGAVYRAINESLIDPSSAQYSDFVTIASVNDDEMLVQVGVNAKNRLGGYTGEENYIAVFSLADDDIELYSDNKSSSYYDEENVSRYSAIIALSAVATPDFSPVFSVDELAAE